MRSPYYEDSAITLYHGDFRDVLPELGLVPDLYVCDPPYGATSLAWDCWPVGWPALLPGNAMWCFGSMRMFLDRQRDFATWRFSHDVVWEKHNGSGFAADRFRRVHDQVVHWYRGPWSGVHHRVPREPGGDGTKNVPTRGLTAHTGKIGNLPYADDGLRLLRSVIRAQSMHARSINETEKPIDLLRPLIEYGCPPGGLVFDPFAGSCSTLLAAALAGRRVIGVELREQQCERAAHRLSTRGACR